MQGHAEVLEGSSDLSTAMDLYNERSIFVKLTAEISSGKAPTRIFKAKPDNIWLNSGAKDGEYYVDIRVKVV
jgi:hypothetical protein